MRGGARVNSGPPPDPTALRRERPSDAAGWRELPRARRGASPRWPLQPDVEVRAELAASQQQHAALLEELGSVDTRKRAALQRKILAASTTVARLEFQLAEQDKAERSLWRELWRTPQANAWAELGYRRDVAAFCRHKVRGEYGSLEDAKEARQWSDRLGLNPAAMLRNRWRIAADDLAVKRAKKSTAGPAEPGRAGTRDRLKAITGGGA